MSLISSCFHSCVLKKPIAAILVAKGVEQEHGKVVFAFAVNNNAPM